MLIFDIETGPLSDAILAEQFKFDPPPHPGEFNPAAVKYGRTKDEDKRAAKLDKSKQAHNLAVENYERDAAQARESAWLEFKGNAALSPITGQVLAIGVQRDGKAGIFAEATEAATIARFWKKYLSCRSDQTKLVGANIVQFDLPFLVRRSWILGVSVPSAVFTYSGKWINFDSLFTDIRDLWTLGQRSGCEASLDAMARALGCGCKPDDVGGADFARLWLGTAEERQQATAYLLNDLKITAAVATRLGVV